MGLRCRCLQAAGLHVFSKVAPVNPVGQVLDQTPVAGTRIAPGGTVTITQAIGP